MHSILLPQAPAERSHLSLARRSPCQAMVMIGLMLSAAVLAVECWRYYRLDAYIDHIEGNMIISGWLLAHGAPLYALQDGYAQFANIYGPLAYLAALPAMWLFGPGIVASKVPAAVALLTTIGLTMFRLRRDTPMQAAQALFLLAAGLVSLSPMSFWTRADPFEVLLVAVGVAGTASPLLVGVCLGLAVNLKIHAFLYFLPILWELWSRRGWRAAPPLVFAAIAAFFAPFLVPGISMHDYLAILLQQIGSRDHNGDPIPVLGYAFALALPILLPLCGRGVATANRLYGIATLGSLVLATYPATFPGAGPYHMLPLLPVMVEARRRLGGEGIGAQFSVFLLLFFAAATTHLTLARAQDRQSWHAYAEEALALARQSPPGTVDVGYGDNQRSYEIAQLAKVELSLHGYPRWIDAQILMELTKTGVDGARRWFPYLTECRVGRWLTPRGETPFVVNSYFYDGASLFDDAFRAAFATNYHPVAESEHFTVWECTRGHD